MSTLEERMTQPPAPGQKSEKERVFAEGSTVEAGEANITPEKVEAIAVESAAKVEKTGEETVSEGKQAFASAVDTGGKLGLSEQEIAQVSGETQIAEALQAVQAKIEALTGEAKGKIEGVAGSHEAPGETAEVGQEKPKYSEEEARKKWSPSKDGTWPGLSLEEKMAYCDPKIVSQEMSDDLQLKNSPEFKPFSGESFSENNEIIKENVRNLVEGYISEGKISSEYGGKIGKSTEDYISLIAQAQQEGSLAENLKAGDIQKIAEDIVNKMVYQNRESFKRGLGDHGVRHIIDGNIAEAMKMVDEYNRANPEKPMTSLDRLKIMTVHFNHDMGYTVGVNRKGFEATGDHPKFSRKLFENQNELYGKLFNEMDLAQMETTIESHDKSRTDFENNQFESIVRLSDNMGLFHDSKLPEIFYSVPENLAVLQKIDLARKAGQSIDGLKEKLKENVMKQEGLDEDTKKALLNAAEEINKMAPDFNLGMLAGKLDGYEMQGSTMIVSIRESDMHKQIQELFDLNQKQFIKALDSYGIDLKKIGSSFDEYVKTDESGNKYVELPMTGGKPALRFNFLPEDPNNPDMRNAEIKKKFAETGVEWAGINIRQEIGRAIENLKNPENRTEEALDRLADNLIAQCGDRMSDKDVIEITEIIGGMDLSFEGEKELEKELEKLKKFATRKEKDFLSVG